MTQPLERIDWNPAHRAYVRVTDEESLCPQYFVVLCDGAMMNCSFHADPAVNKRRAEFIVRAINGRLEEVRLLTDRFWNIA